MLKSGYRLKSEPVIDRWLFAKRMTGSQVAESMGMSRQLFHLKRKGEVGFSDEEVKRLATILGCEVADIAEARD